MSIPEKSIPQCSVPFSRSRLFLPPPPGPAYEDNEGACRAGRPPIPSRPRNWPNSAPPFIQETLSRCVRCSLDGFGLLGIQRRFAPDNIRDRLVRELEVILERNRVLYPEPNDGRRDHQGGRK